MQRWCLPRSVHTFSPKLRWEAACCSNFDPDHKHRSMGIEGNRWIKMTTESHFEVITKVTFQTDWCLVPCQFKTWIEIFGGMPANLRQIDLDVLFSPIAWLCICIHFIYLNTQGDHISKSWQRFWRIKSPEGWINHLCQCINVMELRRCPSN